MKTWIGSAIAILLLAAPALAGTMTLYAATGTSSGGGISVVQTPLPGGATNYAQKVDTGSVIDLRFSTIIVSAIRFASDDTVMTSSTSEEMPFLRLSRNSTAAVVNNQVVFSSFDVIADSWNWPVTLSSPIVNIVFPYSGRVMVVIHDVDWLDFNVPFGTGIRKVCRRWNGDVSTSRCGDIRGGAGGGGSFGTQTVSGYPYIAHVTAGEYLNITLNHTSGVTLGVAINDVTFQYISYRPNTLVGSNGDH